MKKYLMILLILFTLTACENTTDVSISLKPGQDTVELNGIWIDAGAVVSLPNEEIFITTDQTIDTSVIGIQEVLYQYDDQETTYVVTRYVVVVDQTPPEIMLNPGTNTVTLNSTWIDAGAEVTDNSGETLTVEVSGTVDITVVGTYEITYTATDSSGNTMSIIRYVAIVD